MSELGDVYDNTFIDPRSAGVTSLEDSIVLFFQPSLVRNDIIGNATSETVGSWAAGKRTGFDSIFLLAHHTGKLCHHRHSASLLDRWIQKY
jgi:hypothetical protein